MRTTRTTATSHTRAVPGDPLLIIRKLAAQVAEHGVKRISGRVLVDATLFPGGDRELGTDVVMSPIVVNDNLVDLMIGPGAARRRARRVSRRRPPRRTCASSTGSRRAPRASPRTSRFSPTRADANGLHTVTLRGTTPAGGPAILHAYRVPDPARFAEVDVRRRR